MVVGGGVLCATPFRRTGVSTTLRCWGVQGYLKACQEHGQDAGATLLVRKENTATAIGVRTVRFSARVRTVHTQPDPHRQPLSFTSAHRHGYHSIERISVKSRHTCYT